MRIISRLTLHVLACCAVLTAFACTPATAADIRITDARGQVVLPAVPQRVVVLNWDLLEQVLELGITPVGVPEPDGYREWVVQPDLPASPEDIGTRAEPNLERITQLHPDVILAAAPQKDLLDALERIAPVVYLPNFGTSDMAGDVAIHHFSTLATLFGKEETARQKLAKMKQRFAALRERLAPLAVSGTVLPMRFSNTTSAFLFCRNSTTQYVLKQLGLTPAMDLAPKPWGITQKRLVDLHTLEHAFVLYVLPFPEEAAMQQSMLWQSMPFVRSGHIRSVRPVWSYGGAMSMLYMAEAFTESLLAMEADQ